MFIFTVRQGDPIPFTFLKGENEYIVRIPIGFDDDTNAVYSAFVAFSPLTGYADVPGYECIFSITEASIDEGHLHDFTDGMDTRSIITDPTHRKMIRSLICMAIERLIDESDPGIVSMVTHSADLPVKALSKFSQICSVFRRRGFNAGKADPYHGRHVWMMEKA